MGILTGALGLLSSPAHLGFPAVWVRTHSCPPAVKGRGAPRGCLHREGRNRPGIVGHPRAVWSADPLASEQKLHQSSRSWKPKVVLVPGPRLSHHAWSVVKPRVSAGLACLQPCSSLLALLGDCRLTVEWCLVVNAGCDPEPWVGSSDG